MARKKKPFIEQIGHEPVTRPVRITRRLVTESVVLDLPERLDEALVYLKKKREELPRLARTKARLVIEVEGYYDSTTVDAKLEWERRETQAEANERAYFKWDGQSGFILRKSADGKGTIEKVKLYG